MSKAKWIIFFGLFIVICSISVIKSTNQVEESFKQERLIKLNERENDMKSWQCLIAQWKCEKDGDTVTIKF